jgi:DhnA family fructose-bisphosphate aldolase class Ia
LTTLGKSIRLARLKNPTSGRIMTVAVDHAPSYGVLAGIEKICTVIDRVAAAGPDAMVMMKGAARGCFAPHAGRVALILKCSTLSPHHPEFDVCTSRVEEALRLGADAIAMALTVGSASQAQLLSNLGALVREAESVGLPVIVHSYPCGELVPPDERYSVKQVGYAARLVMELGVDIVKTFYTGSAETFAQVVEMASPALVVAAGGPRLETDGDVLRMAHEVVQAGADGITFGRNIWQSDDAAGIIGALKQIVHAGGTVAEAKTMLTSGQGA